MDNYCLNDINPYILHCGYMNEATSPPPGTHFGLRKVKWFEFELILNGEGYILTNGTKLETKKGDLFFRTPGMLVDGVTPYNCYIIYFDMITDIKRTPEYNNPNIANAPSSEVSIDGITFVKSINGLELPDVMKVSNLERYRDLFEKIHTAYLLNGRDSQLILKAILLQILIMAMDEWTYASKKNSSTRSIRNNFNRIMKVKDYIDEHTNENFTINHLASIADLSPSFFCRVFKRITGLTPISYININKINLAKQLLAKTDLSLKEISYECGFENQTYFFTLFKSSQGISPLSYKEKYGTQNLFAK